MFRISLSYRNILVSFDNFRTTSKKFNVNLLLHSPLVRMDSNCTCRLTTRILRARLSLSYSAFGVERRGLSSLLPAHCLVMQDLQQHVDSPFTKYMEHLLSFNHEQFWWILEARGPLHVRISVVHRMLYSARTTQFLAHSHFGGTEREAAGVPVPHSQVQQ